MKKIVFLSMLLFIMVAPCFAGDLWIYDAANQPIGILLGMNDSYMDIYIPSLNRIAGIVIGDEDPNINDRGNLMNYGFTLYNSETCTGNAGLYEPVEKLVRYRDGEGNFHFGYAQSVLTPTTYSHQLTIWGACTPVIGGTQAFPITIVPENNIPFNKPIALPIKYQYQSDSKTINVKPPK